MPDIVVVTLGNIDNDNRVKKIIDFFSILTTKSTHSISINSQKVPNCVNIKVDHRNQRYFGIPGSNLLIIYLKFIFKLLKLRTNTYFHCNDLIALPICVFIKTIGSNSKIVYDCHEYETEVHGLTKSKKILLGLLERFLIRYVDSVITVSNSIALEYARLYKISPPHVILNCPKYIKPTKNDLFRDIFNIKKSQTVFLYQGALAHGRGIEILINTFSTMSPGNVLIIMGNGVLEKSIKAKSQTIPNIFYHTSVSTASLLDYTASADYGISFIEDSCLSNRYCLPNKLFEYIMAGLPVVTSNLPEMKHVVNSHNVGVVSDDNTATGFKEAISRVKLLNYSKLKSNISNARQQFCWEKQTLILKKIYNL